MSLTYQNGSKVKDQHSICILGMHRSGTSVVTRAVNLLGAYLGEENDLYPPASDNEKGVWERWDVVDFHNRLLSKLKGSWHTPPLNLPEHWPTSEEIKPFRDELIGLIEKQFSHHSLWAWKDPRTSVLFPLWKDVLNQMGIELRCIYVVRNPLDVAKSHKKRDNLPYDKSLGLWFYYNIMALQASYSISPYFLSYDKFISNWELELRKCTDKLGIKWPEDESILRKRINEFITPGLRHSVSALDDLNKEDVPQPVVDLYSLLVKMIETSAISKPTIVESIDRMMKELSGYARFFQYDLEKLWDCEQEIRQLRGRVQSQKKELERIHDNIGWQVVNKIEKITGRVFPIQTKKREGM